jgi:hypothetical protein
VIMNTEYKALNFFTEPRVQSRGILYEILHRASLTEANFSSRLFRFPPIIILPKLHTNT